MKTILYLLPVIGLILLLCSVAPAQDSITPDSIMVETMAAENPPDTAVAGGELEYPMSPERYEKLVAYSRFNNIWRFVSFFIGLVTLSLILFTGWSARFRNWASRIKVRFFAIWAFLILILVADYLLNLPFSIYRSFIVERQYGFLNQTFMEWFSEDLLGLGISLLLAIVPMWFFYWLVGRMKRWWLAFSLGMIPFLVLMVVIAPVLISPLFNDFKPLEDKQLESEIVALAEKGGIGDADVFQVDGSRQSNKLNAYVTGLFGSKRIVLYDTLIRSFSLDEIKFVMAHEMGHYVMHHVWWGLLVTVLFVIGALWLMNKTIHPVIRKFRKRFGFESLSDIASLPLVLIFVSVIFFVFQPVTNGFSRYIERQADRYGMEMSEVSGESAAIAFDKLSVYNLSDPDPHPLVEFWFYDHPALKKRMAFVKGFYAEHQ